MAERGQGPVNIPLDGKPRHARLAGEHVAADLLDDGLGGRVVDQLVALVLVVDIVAHAHKLAAVVRAGEQDHCHAKQLVDRDALRVGRVRLEHKLVDPHGNRPDQQRVELLVVVVRLGGADVGEFPLEVCVGGGLGWVGFWGARESERGGGRATYPFAAVPDTQR